MTRQQAMTSVGKCVTLTDGVKPWNGLAEKLFMHAWDGGEWTMRVAFDVGLTINITIDRLQLAA